MKIKTLSLPLLFLAPVLNVANTAIAQEPVVVPDQEPSPIDGLKAFRDLTFEQALVEAKKTGKIVMADFYADWCTYCKKLDQTTWRHHDVMEWIEANAIAIKINGEVEFSTKQRYDVHKFPTVVFIRADGSKIDMHVGYVPAFDFMDVANKTLFGKTTIELAKDAADAQPNDPMVRKTYADKLAQRFQYPLALTEYLWCLDEGVQHNRAFASYRDSFLFWDIARFGKKYPAAIDALKERAKTAEAELLGGSGTVEGARHLTLLNEAAGMGADTYRVWSQIQESADLDNALADEMFDAVFKVLIAERRYAEIAAGVGDVFKRIDQRIQRYWMNSQSMGEGVDEELTAILREQVVKDGAQYYEAMLGAGQAETAAQIATKLLEFQESGQTFAALIASAVRAEDLETARALGERGLAELSRSQQSSIKRALRKLPKQQ
jgi:thioredoxin-related protein